MIDLCLTSIMMGAGLAMDAFSVSLANGLGNPYMKKRGCLRIAGAFSLFQFLMPMIGWICVHTIITLFAFLRPAIPWVGFVLLMVIGGKMLADGIRWEWQKGKQPETEVTAYTEAGREVGTGLLLLQAVATSIDALTVGFTSSDYTLSQAFLSSLIIAAVTLIICLFGIALGKKIGTKMTGGAQIMGGVILILIGIRVVTG